MRWKRMGDWHTMPAVTQGRKFANVSIERSRDARDKSRNEQQKAVLLREMIEAKQQQKSAALRTSTEKIVARSKELCEQAKKLKAARTSKNR